MKANFELIIHSLTSFSYSWIPALLILWFLIALKPKTKLIAPLLGFLAGSILSASAGHLNRFSSLHLFPGPESPQFFLMVGLVEEIIKFVASTFALLLVSFKNWRNTLHRNWIAQCMSGALGFAAAENFIYGVDGQGGIARVIPLIAHTCFAIFWGIGLYKASFEKNKLKAAAWILLGLLEGILLHALYDCIVSENIIPATWKILSWLMIGIFLFLIINWHTSIIQKLKASDLSFELIEKQENLNIKKQQNNKKNWFLESFGSVVMPGIGHMSKGEYFTGLTFFALAFLLPYVILRFGLNELAGKLVLSPPNDEKFLIQFAFIILITSLLYLGIGFWAAWELKQDNKYIDNSERKKRFSALFPVSTLFFISLLCSFFLPALNKPTNKKDGEEKSMLIKEIPLGITWEIEKTPPAPQKEENMPIGTSNAINSISIDKDQEKKPNQKSSKEQKAPAQDKLPTGVQNSDSLNKENLPNKLPEVGYIGVQLSEIIFNQQIRPYVAFVYPGTSAERAGLKSGDLIVSIDGQKSEGLNALEVSNLVRGPLGTSVEITVLRDGIGEVKIKAYRTGTLFQSNNGSTPITP